MIFHYMIIMLSCQLFRVPRCLESVILSSLLLGQLEQLPDHYQKSCCIRF
jgi:hypothetical protein